MPNYFAFIGRDPGFVDFTSPDLPEHIRDKSHVIVCNNSTIKARGCIVVGNNNVPSPDIPNTNWFITVPIDMWEGNLMYTDEENAMRPSYDLHDYDRTQGLIHLLDAKMSGVMGNEFKFMNCVRCVVETNNSFILANGCIINGENNCVIGTANDFDKDKNHDMNKQFLEITFKDDYYPVVIDYYRSMEEREWCVLNKPTKDIKNVPNVEIGAFDALYPQHYSEKFKPGKRGRE